MVLTQETLLLPGFSEGILKRPGHQVKARAGEPGVRAGWREGCELTAGTWPGFAQIHLPFCWAWQPQCQAMHTVGNWGEHREPMREANPV